MTMMFSTSFYGAMGIAFSFLPAEVLSLFGTGINELVTVILQLLGAMYIGFALMNYTARKAIIGGIYNRALLMGNAAHSFIASLLLLKFIMVHFNNLNPAIWVVSLSYCLLGLSFVKLLFSSPVKK